MRPMLFKKSWNLFCRGTSSQTCLFKVHLDLHQNFLIFIINFYDHRKIWFHVNAVNNCFIILCIFRSISFWCRSIFFLSFFWNQNRVGFKKILEIKLLDESIVSKKGWKRNKGNPTSQLNMASQVRVNRQWYCGITNSKLVSKTFITLTSCQKAQTNRQFFLHGYWITYSFLCFDIRPDSFVINS